MSEFTGLARLQQLAADPALQADVRTMFLEALCTEGAHHKQWWLEQLAGVMGFNFETELLRGDYEPGRAP